MIVLFYLPVITNWWFENIIVPMIEGLAVDRGVSQIHLVVAPPWSATGLEPWQLSPLGRWAKVRCHVIDGSWGDDAAAQFRLDGAALPGLAELIATIGADITLVRSADFAFPAQFPGRVRHIMEGAASPYRTDGRWVVLDAVPFSRGLLPPQAADFAGPCAEVIRGLAPPRLDADEARARLGLDGSRPVIAVPLHYEHEENLFLRHTAHRGSLDLVRDVLDHSDGEALLAVSDHPLNRIHVDRDDLDRALASRPDRIVAFTRDDATALLAACADVMIADLSKSWSLAAFNGTPQVDLGTPSLGGWVGALPGLAAMPRLPRRADLPTADPEALALWFGWHLGARVLDPEQTSLAAVLRRFDDTPEIEDFRRNRAALERQAVVAP